MKKVVAIIVFVFLFSCPCISLADASPPVVSASNPPDISKWNIIGMSRIELRVSDCASVYLGLETDYNDPNNLINFVRVISRHIPLPISRCKDYNKLLLSETAIMLYAQKEEVDLLSERSRQSDPFLYIQWQTTKVPRTGRSELSGDVNIWFLSASGSWLSTKNERVEVEFLTEDVSNGKSHNIFSGRKYGVGGYYHILRVSRSDIVKLLEKEKK